MRVIHRPPFGAVLAAALVVGAFGTYPARAAADVDLRIDADFPGGNIVLERVDRDDVFLRQDLRDTNGNWFYWCFRARGAAAAGRTVRFHFTRGPVVAARGPAVSTDGGATWTWLGADAVQKDAAGFVYKFPRDLAADGEVRFGMTVPYVERDLRALLARHKDRPELKVEMLCKSKNGRDVELLRVGRIDGRAAHRVLLTARHHACESMASFELEGVIDAVLADDDAGRWLRENVEFLIVPFMDKDGVEDGDQGKNRKPHDHNRDYIDEPIHPSVAALRKLVPDWSGGRLRIALDLHCPALRGELHEVTHFVLGPDERNAERVTRFARMLEAARKNGPLPFRERDNLPFGKGWNNQRDAATFARWAGSLPEVKDSGFAVTLELPYANAGGQAVTPESARHFGRQLGRAMHEWLIAPDPARRGPAD